MSEIIINDLEISRELSQQALQELKGGYYYTGYKGGWKKLRYATMKKERLKDYLSTQPNIFNGYSFT